MLVSRSGSGGECRQMGQRRIFFGKRMPSNVPAEAYASQSPLIFLVLSEKTRNISFQRPPHGHDTWARGSVLSSPPAEGHRAQGGLGTTTSRFLSLLGFPLCSLSMLLHQPKVPSAQRAAMRYQNNHQCCYEAMIKHLVLSCLISSYVPSTQF